MREGWNELKPSDLTRSSMKNQEKYEAFSLLKDISGAEKQINAYE